MPVAHCNRVRLVPDTNTAVSGLHWGGPPGRLIDMAIAGNAELAVSDVLLAELRTVLSREKFAIQLARRRLAMNELFGGYAALTTRVIAADIPLTITRDPSDNAVLAAALGADAGLIVAGDAHLLELGIFHGINIVTAMIALDMLRS
jgi:putative PIN family toxin of toxin-antitoxin system